MLPRADVSLTPVARADAVTPVIQTGDPRQEAFQRSLAGSLGKSMQGEVLSRLTDGSFLVKVAGTSARMLLPPGAAPGQQVPLTLVALSPRPTFEIATPQGSQVTIAYSEAAPALPTAQGNAAARAAPLVYLDGGSAPAPQGAAQAAAQAAEAPAAQAPIVQKPISYAAQLLAKAPLTPAERLPSFDAKSAPAVLSESARTIASVLNQTAASAPTRLVMPVPLTSTPTAPPAQLAAALQQTLSESGLFYESLVAEWSNGERPLATLAREPQMQRALPATDAPEPARAPAPQAQAAAPALPGIDQESAAFINYQLNTQEQARVVWEGQPWPGQAMRWEIARDAPERQQSQAEREADPPWRSGVKLRFPLLGEIEASVVLHQGQLHIQVEAGAKDTGALLREHADLLADAMEAAGLPLSSLNIRAGGRDE